MNTSALLTVENLLSLNYSTTSSIEKVALKGKFKIVLDNEEGDEKGTVLLVDSRTRQSIHCNVDLMRPEALHAVVVITSWNYIYCEISCVQFLEIKLENVHRLRSSENESILHECLESDSQDFEESLQQGINFCLPEDDVLATEGTSFYIVGKVINISKLYTRLDLTTTFFVQLTSEENLTASITIMFRGASLVEYYHSFQIGGLYTFHKICLSTAFNTREEYPRLFEFDENMSSVQMITPSQYQEALRNTLSMPLKVSRFRHDNATIIVCILRVIDTVLGVYEVNDGNIICLFNYPNYEAGRPFRVSTILRLHRVHRVSVRTYKDHPSCMFERLWKMSGRQSSDEQTSYTMIAACSKSCVEILSFPDHCELVQTIHDFLTTENLMDIYTDMIDLHFPDVLRLLEIYASLLTRFHDIPNLLEALQTLKTHFFKQCGSSQLETGVWSSIKRFLNNDCGCSIEIHIDDHFRNIETEKEVLYINSYPTISVALNQLLKCAEEISASYAIGGLVSIKTPTVHTLTAEYNEGFDHPVFGFLTTGEDGKIYFGCDKIRLPLLIMGALNAPVHCGLYFLKRFRWIKEDLSYTKVNREECLLFFEYLCCTVDDLILTSSSDQHMLNFFCRPVLAHSHISHFMVSENQQLSLQDDIYHVMHVVEISPAMSFTNRQNSMHLRSYVKALLYSIGSEKATKDKVVFVLDSVKGSLRYKSMLKASRWYVIQGLINEKAQRLNIEEHRIYPICITSDIGSRPVNHIDLDYIQLNTGVFHPSDRVFTVSELISNSAQDGSSPRTINIKGIVVAKNFTQGYQNNCGPSQFKEFGIGTGKSDRKLNIRLRELNSLETIDIYLELKNIEYPTGLVIGASVLFKNLLQKGNSGALAKPYCMDSEQTTVEVQTISPPHETSITLPYPTTKMIAELYDDTSKGPNVFRFMGYIKTFQSASIEALCVNCKSLFKKGTCAKSCQNAQKLLMASATIEFCDGTGIAQAFVDGERLFFLLLQLNSAQKERLVAAAFEQGKIEFKYDRARSVAEEEKAMLDIEAGLDGEPKNSMPCRLLQDMCDQAKKIQFYIYGSLYKTKSFGNTVNNDIVKQLNLFPLNISDGDYTLSTLVRKKPTLRTMEIQVVDPAAAAWEFLNKI